ncbi:MAG: hypothetical protein Q9196_006956, partial [Gyalolechia fulgens]
MVQPAQPVAQKEMEIMTPTPPSTQAPPTQASTQDTGPHWTSPTLDTSDPDQDSPRNDEEIKKALLSDDGTLDIVKVRKFMDLQAMQAAGLQPKNPRKRKGPVTV